MDQSKSVSRGTYVRYNSVMYDIIGDIHGHAAELVELLEKLGYSEQSGVFRHASRQVIFCGDFIDRGPRIPDVVAIAKAMVENDAGLAVMGNHEFNALAYHTEDSRNPGHFLRPHTDRNRFLHGATLDQFEEQELKDALEWFRTLPATIDLGALRVVHACWSPSQLKIVADACKSDGAFTPSFLKRATDVADPLFDAIECVMKGPELPLPEGVSVTDKEGNVRKRIRIRWFDDPADQTWSTYALPGRSELPNDAVPVDAPAQPYPKDAPPVFVGHYWLPNSNPSPLKPNIACLDYSVAKHGSLCAYRFDGEATLSSEKFVAVPSRESGAR